MKNASKEFVKRRVLECLFCGGSVKEAAKSLLLKKKRGIRI